MSIDVEYAIKKDIRNNPVVREIDVQQKRDFRRTTCIAVLIVGMGLFAAWQHFKILQNGYEVQKLQLARAAEESINRQLRLEVETLRAPQRIERIAVHDLHMVAPVSKDTLVIERATPGRSRPGDRRRRPLSGSDVHAAPPLRAQQVRRRPGRRGGRERAPARRAARPPANRRGPRRSVRGAVARPGPAPRPDRAVRPGTLDGCRRGATRASPGASASGDVDPGASASRRRKSSCSRRAATSSIDTAGCLLTRSMGTPSWRTLAKLTIRTRRPRRSVRRSAPATLTRRRRFSAASSARDPSPISIDRCVPAQVPRLEALKLPGIRVIPEPRRYYPKLELAAHVLGFVGVDNEGLGGIERTYDNVIRGNPGRMLLQVDARRKRMDSRIQQAPTPGATVELTLDLYLQHIAERELAAGVEDNHAAGGTAIIMDPQHRRNPRAGELPGIQPQRRPAVQRRRETRPGDSGRLRAGLDVQDRHGIGGLRGRRLQTRRSDRYQPWKDRVRIAGHQGRQRAQPRRAVLRRRDRRIEQRRCRSRSACGSAPSAWPATSSDSASVRRCFPILPGRAAASCGIRRN